MRQNEDQRDGPWGGTRPDLAKKFAQNTKNSIQSNQTSEERRCSTIFLRP